LNFENHVQADDQFKSQLNIKHM